MQEYLEKFNKQYKGQKSIDIEIFNEEPLSIKYARFNQGGAACYCMENSNNAKQKTKNGWQEINCDKYNCQYREKNEYGKSACNRMGWLKFIIPSVCKDRIFLMRITGQTSINRLKDYFNLQKAQGNSIKACYTLYLKQEEQSNNLGKTFNNYILDILKKDDFKSINTNSTVIENTKKQTDENNKNVNNTVVKEETQKTEQIPVTNTVDDKKPKEKVVNKKSTAKPKKEIENKVNVSKEQDKSKEISNKENNDSDNYYALLRTFTKTLTDKEGKQREYLVGEFADSKDKTSNIIIRPEDAEELSKCDLGTFVRLDVIEKGTNKFAMKLEFIQKCLKKIAA